MPEWIQHNITHLLVSLGNNQKWAKKKKGLLLFDYACHPCTGTMLIFSVYLSVCLMSQPEGWTIIWGKVKYINPLILWICYVGISIFTQLFESTKWSWGLRFKSEATLISSYLLCSCLSQLCWKIVVYLLCCPYPSSKADSANGFSWIIIYWQSLYPGPVISLHGERYHFVWRR